MSGSGFHKFFAAMVLQSVDALSDDEATDKPTGSSSSVAAAKNAPKPKATSKASSKTKTVPKAKPKAKQRVDKSHANQGASKTDAGEEEPEVEETPMKKPAGKPVARKRPAAATTAGQSGPKKLKVYTYKYKDTDTFGYKVDGKQVLTVTRHMFMAVYGMPLESFDFPNVSTLITPWLPSKLKPVPGLSDEVRQVIVAAKLKVGNALFIPEKTYSSQTLSSQISFRSQDAVKAELIRTAGNVQAGRTLQVWL